MDYTGSSTLGPTSGSDAESLLEPVDHLLGRLSFEEHSLCQRMGAALEFPDGWQSKASALRKLLDL